jgi:SagB-type dehydrogenase family enzyme
MTRFLSRVWNDPLCGSLNENTERLFAYHQATKHSYQSVRLDAHFLDWKNQPNPFRIYEGAPTIALPPDPDFSKVGTFAAIAALDDHPAKADKEIPLDVAWLSRLLWHSMAISAWKKVPGSGNRYSLRVNPSSGNLHPTETYVALRGIGDIGDGLYHYRADSHAIELCSPGAATLQLAEGLKIPWAAESPLMIGLTSIFWREAWKYRDRAYRYCCHDLGHAMMSLLLAARALGLPGMAVAHFGDSAIARVLGLSGGDEAPMAFLVFPPEKAHVPKASRSTEEFAGIPNELSPQEIPYELLLDIHCATILPDSVSPLAIPHEPNANVAGEARSSAGFETAPALDASLAAVARRRRSALDFDAHTAPMERSHLEQLLDFATRNWRADWHGAFDVGRAADMNSGSTADLITLYLYVHRVRDCDPGIYRWESSTRTLTQLHRANVERVAAYLSLEQALAGNSCFTVSMVANLAGAAKAFGNRGYRYVHFEAGAIGQRLYVGAEAMNLNATGIGAFYDDDVHRYLGFLEESDRPVHVSVEAAEQKALVMLNSPTSRHSAGQTPPTGERTAAGPSSGTPQPRDSRTLPQQVIYHFAVGPAVPDPRLGG